MPRLGNLIMAALGAALVLAVVALVMLALSML